MMRWAHDNEIDNSNRLIIITVIIIVLVLVLVLVFVLSHSSFAVVGAKHRLPSFLHFMSICTELKELMGLCI